MLLGLRVTNHIQIAAHNGNTETVEVLIDSGADSLDDCVECAVMQV